MGQIWGARALYHKCVGRQPGTGRLAGSMDALALKSQAFYSSNLMPCAKGCSPPQLMVLVRRRMFIVVLCGGIALTLHVI